MAWAESHLHAKFHLDSFNRLAEIHQRYREDRTGQDRQQSDIIGRTVLQTVALKTIYFDEVTDENKLAPFYGPR